MSSTLPIDDRVKARQAEYKSLTLGSTEKRGAKAVALSKRKKGATFLAKRTMVVQEDIGFEADAETLAAALHATAGPSGADRLAALKLLRRWVSGHADDEASIHELMSRGLIPALAGIIASGVGAVVPVMAEDASFVASEEERLEATWCCINVAAGNHAATMQVIEHAGPYLLALLSSSNNILVEYAAWALGNCAGEDQEARQLLLAQGVLPALASLLAGNVRPVARTAAWSISNMMKMRFEASKRTKAADDIQLEIVNAAVKWVNQEDAKDQTVTVECAWILAFLTDTDDHMIDFLLENGVLAAVCALALRGIVPALSPCFRVIGNVTSQRPKAIEYVCGIPALLELFATICSPSRMTTADDEAAVAFNADHDAGIELNAATEPSVNTLPDMKFSMGFTKEVLWVVSNLLGGAPDVVLRLLSTELSDDLLSGLAVCFTHPVQHKLGFLPLLVHHLNGSWNLKKYAAWGIINIALQQTTLPEETGPVHAFLPAILSFDEVLPAFIAFLSAPDLELVHHGLTFVDIVLFNWYRPEHVTHSSPFAGPHTADMRYLELDLPEEMKRMGPDTSGVQLVEQCDGIAALEHVRMAYGETDDAAIMDSQLEHRHKLANWARALQDTFFGTDEEFEEEVDVGPDMAPADAGRERRAFLPAWMTRTTE